MGVIENEFDFKTPSLHFLACQIFNFYLLILFCRDKLSCSCWYDDPHTDFIIVGINRLWKLVTPGLRRFCLASDVIRGWFSLKSR